MLFKLKSKGKPRNLAAMVTAAAALATESAMPAPVDGNQNPAPTSDSTSVGNHTAEPDEVPKKVIVVQMIEAISENNETTFPPDATPCYVFPPFYTPKAFCLSSIQFYSLEIPPGSSLKAEISLPHVQELAKGSKKGPIVLTRDCGIFDHLNYRELEGVVAKFPVMSKEDQLWLIENPLCGFGGAFVQNKEVLIPRTEYNGTTLVVVHVPLNRQVQRKQFAACLSRV